MRRVSKRKWISGLLSDYKQGKKYLKQKKIGEEDYRVSVLGVLEDVRMEHIDYLRPEPLATWYEHISDDGTIYWTRGNNEHRLSVETAKWAQIPCNPKLQMQIGDKTILSTMSVLNDEYDVSFKDFATAIREQL